ncbi:DUF427 domain-containing protein [Donghicola eburneus]|jgi:uncharacterized protein (DUF427 family)|uniref:Nucleotidyltransferase-domain containing protein n=1 Tax=Donghicola eburneus TaxID=393278 RepID=A0A1M4N156_9RHOB|nr:DUF427 domain-containing protein [Donghicola eburneus]SCM68551.1 Nucleotidyltransferase-domain containing protein [Donghicola eburneus]SFQ27046.1 Uncharacterized conserved protein, DUF427 family [Donghicola eburneus]
MTANIKIHANAGTYVVRAGGAVLGESSNTLELVEGDYTPVVYFPREDIAMAFLDQSSQRTTCPFKGEAQYYNIVTKSTTIENAAWSYEDPASGLEQIKGYLAFHASPQLAIEEL